MCNDVNKPGDAQPSPGPLPAPGGPLVTASRRPGIRALCRRGWLGPPSLRLSIFIPCQTLNSSREGPRVSSCLASSWALFHDFKDPSKFGNRDRFFRVGFGDTSLPHPGPTEKGRKNVRGLEQICKQEKIPCFLYMPFIGLPLCTSKASSTKDSLPGCRSGLGDYAPPLRWTLRSEVAMTRSLVPGYDLISFSHYFSESLSSP